MPWKLDEKNSNLYQMGMGSKVGPLSIVFPNLRYLALGNHTFTQNWQVDWIISHGSSLVTLILEDCPIPFCIYPGCSLGNNTTLVSNLAEEKRRGLLYPVRDFQGRQKQDEEAFIKLLDTVRCRSREKGLACMIDINLNERMELSPIIMDSLSMVDIDLDERERMS